MCLSSDAESNNELEVHEGWTTKLAMYSRMELAKLDESGIGIIGIGVDELSNILVADGNEKVID